MYRKYRTYIELANGAGPLVHAFDEVVNEFQHAELVFRVFLSVQVARADNKEERGVSVPGKAGTATKRNGTKQTC